MLNVIYAIVWGKTDSIYIGSALNFTKRRSQHLDGLRRGRHFNLRMQRCYDREGEEPRFIVLETVPSSRKLISREQAYLDALFQRCPTRMINFRRVAQSQLGLWRKASAAQVARIRKMHIGAKRSDATRKRMSKAQTGRTFSDATRLKMSEAAKARWRNPAERAILCDAAATRAIERPRNHQGQFV